MYAKTERVSVIRVLGLFPKAPYFSFNVANNAKVVKVQAVFEYSRKWVKWRARSQKA
jgi:hypothetical protein